jgi:transcriptional regulator with XRE-family HTH domain
VSQQALSYQVDLSRDRIWRIENGIADPTPDERRAIAEALGTTVADVFPSSLEVNP